MSAYLLGLVGGFVFFLLAMIPQLWRSSPQTGTRTALRVLCWVIAVVLLAIGMLPILCSL